MGDIFNVAKSIPTWIDKSFFEKVIRHSERDSQAQVADFSVTSGSKPGDNFASAVFRASITFTSKFSNGEKTISVIMKVKPQYPPEMEQMNKMMDTPHFKTEMEMFDKVLPEIQSLWLSAGDNDLLCPKLIYQSNEPSPVVVLEDVSVHGFEVIEQPPEDFEVSKQIVRRLAKYHAANFHLINEQKLDVSEFNSMVFSNEMTADMIFSQGLEAFIDVIKEWEGCERYIPNLETLRKTYPSKIHRTYTPNRSEFGFNVLNHGDFHLKNMLFKENSDGNIEDFYFIDFQIAIYATPAIDLIYAMYFFLSSENRQTRRDEFIACYHQQFVESLRKFGYLKATPSLIDLHVELLRNGPFEVLLSICLIIFFYIDLSTLTSEDMDLGEGSKKAKRRMYKNEAFKEMIMKELPRFLHCGFF